MGRTKHIVTNIIKLLSMLIVYAIVVYQYSIGNIGAKKHLFFVSMLLFVFCCTIIVYGYRIKFIPNKLSVRLFAIVSVSCIDIFMVEYIVNDLWRNMRQELFLLNCLLLLSLVAVPCLLWDFRVILTVTSIFMYVYAIASYFVMEFKNSPLRPTELMAAKTGLSVASGYKYVMTEKMLKVLLVLAVILAGLSVIKDMDKVGVGIRQKIFKLLGGIIGIVYGFVFVYNVDWKTMGKFELFYWDMRETYKEAGSVLSFVSDWQNLKLEIPKGYSKATAQSILADYEKKDENTLKPIVVAVMNETFSDLSVLDNAAKQDVLSNWNSVDDYIMKGYVYASVWAGGTADSEMEFLTGNSMANLINGTYPYQMYDFTNVENLAGILSESGYITTAMHPNDANNWNRNVVYRQMGFNEFLAIEDFENQDYLRWTISDEANYSQLKKEIEETSDSHFIFNITMQNHGGYDINSLSEEMLVAVQDDYMDMEQLITYLSLVNVSDKEFIRLLDYLRRLEQPVIFCMFGDHQPSVEWTFYERNLNTDNVGDAQLQRAVPYMIWANYDTGVEASEVDMGINYLGSNLLDIIGVRTEYTAFLLDMQKSIPIVNGYSYMTDDNVWHELDEDNEWMRKYSIVEYYEMFDR